MQNKTFFRVCLAVIAAGLMSCSKGSSVGQRDIYRLADDEIYVDAPEEGELNLGMSLGAVKTFNNRMKPFNSLIVCRDKQCAPAEMSKSREYIFNALAQLVDNNLDETALLCEANPETHVCVNPYLTVPAKIGITPAYVYFDGVKIIDAGISKGKTALDLALGYNLSYNGQTPTVCKPDEAMIYVKSNNNIVLNGNGFKCDMTSVGTTIIRVMFNIDYVDLDYGYIGGYYSIGLSGPAYGGGTGYGLIRLAKDAYPLSPALMKPKQEETAVSLDDEDEEDDDAQSVYKPQVNSDALRFDDDEGAGALAPVEVKDDKGASLESYSGRKPLDTGSLYENADTQENNHLAGPVRIGEDSLVTGDRVILKPEGTDKRQNEFGDEFEEVYIDDLDEYIK